MVGTQVEESYKLVHSIPTEHTKKYVTNQSGGKVIFHAHGQITLTTPNIQNVTNNSAELVAFTRALQWAAARPDICHVVMRYDSMYAAMIASGVWKAKKHKLLAAEAQRAWKALKGKLGETVWLRHVKGHSGHEWNNLVDRYADLGRQGEYRYEEAYAVT
jgi:ribonuclease HI